MTVTISNSLKKIKSNSMLNTCCMLTCLYATSLHFFWKTLQTLTLFLPFFPPLLVPLTLYTASSSLFHISSFFSPSSSFLLPIFVHVLCPSVFLFMSLIIFLPLSLACCAQPSALRGVCFPLPCYAESCHMRVWTC